MTDKQRMKRQTRNPGLFLRLRRFAAEIGSTRSEVARLIAAKKVEVFDIDGVLYIPVKEVPRIRGIALPPRKEARREDASS